MSRKAVRKAMKAMFCLALFAASGCASARVTREAQRSTEFVGSFYENAQESIFFPCGVRMSEDGWWVRFADGVQADRMRYQYKGSGFPTSSHDVRVLGRVTPVQRTQQPIRFGTGFHTREIVIEKVLEVANPGWICAAYEKSPAVWDGAGPVGTRIMGAAASDDMSIVAIMEQGGDLTLWRSRTGELVRRFASGHTFRSDQGPDTRMWFNPQGTLLAEADNDGYVRVWGIPDGELRWKLAHSPARPPTVDASGATHFHGAFPVSSAVFTPDGDALVSLSWGRALTWSMKTGNVIDTLRGFGAKGTAAPTAVVAARDPPRIIATGEDEIIRAYTVSEGLPIFAARAEHVKGGEMVISPDNRWIAILVGNDSVALWSLSEGRITRTLSFPHFFNGGMTFSPDSKRLAVAAGSGAIFIWDVATGTPVRSIHGLLGWARRMWFNPRGDSIVFTSVFAKELYATAVVPSPRFLRPENALTGRVRGVKSFGACVDSASTLATAYRDVYRALVSRTDEAGAQKRARLRIPALPAAQVRLVGDTAVCRRASIAYDATLEQGKTNEQVVVLELGASRAVIRDIGVGDHWLNVIFNRDFTAVLSKFAF